MSMGMTIVFGMLFVMQFIFAVYSFTRKPQSLAGFLVQYINFCTMFFTFPVFIMLLRLK